MTRLCMGWVLVFVLATTSVACSDFLGRNGKALQAEKVELEARLQALHSERDTLEQSIGDLDRFEKDSLLLDREQTLWFRHRACFAAIQALDSQAKPAEPAVKSSN